MSETISHRTAPKLLVALGGATPQSCSGTSTATLTSGATNTPTRTPTVGPSPTPSNTSTAAPTATQPPPGAFNNATFVYDGDGKRVKSAFNNNATTTYFVGTHYEVTNPGANQTITKYYYAGSQRIAMRTNGTLNYLLGDHLGSTSLTTNASGQIVSQLRYKAWGETRYSSGTTPTDYTYTGQYSYTSDFGLMFYNARWYDPSLGRFNQPDTIIPQTQGVQGWDRYAYANNNPILYNDPTGHCAAPGLSIICGAVIGAVAGAAVSYTRQVAKNISENGWSANAFTDVDGNDIIATATVGAIAGGLIGSGVGIAAGTAMGAALIGAGTGAAGSAVGYTIAAGSEYDSEEMLVNAGIGLAAGAAGGYVGGLGLGLQGKILQAEISMVGGEAQMAAGDFYDYDLSTTRDLVGAGAMGGLAYFAGEFVKPVPIVGPLADDLLRSGLVEWFGNESQNLVDEQDNR